MKRAASLAVLAVVAALASLASCACDPPAAAVAPDDVDDVEDEAPRGPELRWAPAEGVLLFPDDTLTRVSGLLVDGADEDAVRAELLSFVAENGGARPDTPLSIELTGDVDAASIPIGVELVRLDDGERVALDATVTLRGRGVRLTPQRSLEVGARYALVVRGGAGGLRGLDGAAEASSSFSCMLHLGGRTGDAAACEDLPGDEAARTRTVDALTAIAVALGPELDALQALGVRGESLIGLSLFSVTDSPAALLDAQRGIGPWPSDLSRDAQGRTTLPLVDLPGVDLAGIGAATAELPGFSTSARLRVPFSCAPEADGAHPRLFSLDAARDFEELDLEHAANAAGTTWFMRKRPALAAASSYAIVVPSAVACAGGALAPTLDAALLRARAPLWRAGRSTTALLTDEQAKRLEPVRARLTPLLDAMQSRGTPRREVALAVPFDTLDASAFIETYTGGLEARGVEPDLSDVAIATPFDRGVWAVMPNVRTVVSGRFSSLELIDPRTLRRFPDGPAPSEVPFVLTMPDETDGPVPVVLFGHGLTTTKELAYLMADRLAVLGFATLAIDLPFHGERSVCMQDSQCGLLQSCTEAHECVRSDGSAGELAIVDSLWADGPAVPLATGAAYILVDDLVASRDHVLQGSVDLWQTLRLLSSGRLDEVLDGATLSREDHRWLGVSLGGIYGATLAGLTSSIGSLALNVPGADFIAILEESSVIGPMLGASLERLGVDRDSEAFLDYEDLGHLVLDPVDPLNLAARATHARPAGWSEKRLLLQMAESDQVIPNVATRILSEVTGVAATEYTPLVSNHIFMFDPTSFEGARARDDAMRFLTGEP